MQICSPFGRFLAVSSAKLAVVCLSATSFLSLASPANAQTVVFNDTLAGGSTLNAASGTPTADSTNYDVWSSKNANTTALGSTLNINLASTSGGFVEAQALFTTSPISLLSVGEYVESDVTFTDGNGTANSGAGLNSLIYGGLYNSGGKAPVNQNAVGTPDDNAGLTATSGTNPSGGTTSWSGYMTALSTGSNSSSSKEYTRPAQSVNTLDSEAQDLVAEGQTDGYSTATQLTGASEAGAIEPVLGDVYTLDILVTLTSLSPETVSITSDVYNGVGTSGAALLATPLTGTATGTLLTSSTFDGLAFGWRNTDSDASGIQVSEVEVSTNVPEPTSIGFLAVGGLALLRRRRAA